MGERDSTRKLRFLIAWGALAALLFSSSWYLTHAITAIHTKSFSLLNTDFQDIGVFSLSDTASQKPVKVAYNVDEKHKTAELFFSSQLTSATIFLNHFDSDQACYDENDRHGGGKSTFRVVSVTPRVDFGGSSHDSYAIQWNAASSAPYPMALRCKIKPIIEDETFIGRRAYFTNLEDPVFYGVRNVGTPTPFIELDFTEMADAENIRFLGGFFAGQSWSERNLKPNNERVAVLWDSAERSSLRDIIIVIIGALIALGAAELIEAIRPYIEAITQLPEKLRPEKIRTELNPSTTLPDIGHIPGSANSSIDKQPAGEIGEADKK
jgi:hypothetical protein